MADPLPRLGMVPNGAEEEGVEYFEGTKVFYCSRTHSQLSQLASEVRKLSFPAATMDDKPDVETAVAEEIKYSTLGSRKNLCINPKVNQLGSAVAINEKCLHLQQSREEAGSKCPYVPKPENEPLCIASEIMPLSRYGISRT
jgi:chromosome transmission fidelity protein 1